MHELSIAENMIDLIRSALGGTKELERVNVTLGPLSGISVEALTFCFAEVASGSGFGSPELAITEVDARLQCTDCDTVYATRDFYSVCPSCGSMNRRILGGREFSVDSVELYEDSDEEEDERGG
jgi:hydrogenase nickel incorporation protein HypA/HybF